MSDERTLEGIRTTRAAAEQDDWDDYGTQARADVDWMIARLDKLEESIAGARGAEEAMLEEYFLWRRTWENNPVMAALREGIVALRRIRFVIDPPPPKDEAA